MISYALQQVCTDEEKQKFWEELDEEVRKVPAEEKLWVGGDFNGHVGSDNTDREETVGRYGYSDKNDKNTEDCKVILGERITNQQRPVICKLRAAEYKVHNEQGMPKTKWCKLEEEKCRNDFKEKARERLERRRQEERCDWETIAGDMRILGEEVLVHREYRRPEWRHEGMKKVLRMAKQKDKNSTDIYQMKLIKSEEGNVLTKDEEILERWRTYFMRLMNKENPREVREGEQAENWEEVETITEDEVKRMLKKMKNRKAVGPDNLPIEVWKCMGEGITFLCTTLNKICEDEEIPESWWKSTLIPIYKKKGDIMACGNSRGIRLMRHCMKLYECIIEHRLRRRVNISDEQFAFMKGKSITDALFALKQVQEKYREGYKDLHGVFIDLEKAYDRVLRGELCWFM
ncbi:uncharacterized protein LOC125048337 [Penaeus chinensis]|uniref:uncharacterized protein LOC125048337 n=1 Tax=Penaeus chinensis TaxID=139456 RepID=UPI001FB5EA50|nr:uncharacterized protein LOC125048337 [Penaeus chinensis]